MKRLAIAFALLALFAVPASAQHGMHGGMMKWLDEPTIEAAKALVGDLTSWARSSVLPEAQRWKNQLDAALSPADLAKLNELRAQAATLRERKGTLARAMREAWTSEDYDALKSARTQMKQLGKEREAILEQLKPIAVANRATLESIGESAKPKVKEWADEARAIGEKWWEEHKTSISPEAAGAIGRLMKHKHDLYGMLEPKLRTKSAVAKFMLWNGDDFTRQIDEMVKDADLNSVGELDLE
jgi:hypothetical protein